MSKPSRPPVSTRLEGELKRLRREGRTVMELSVTNRNPNIDEPVDFTVRLWHFSPLCVWLPVRGATVVVRRTSMNGISMQADVTTDDSGEATVTETYTDPADLACYAEYIPASNSPFKGARSNTVTVTARVGTALTLEWPMDERVCEDLKCYGPARGRLSDQYGNGVRDKEIIITAHWHDSNDSRGTRSVLRLRSDSQGFIRQTLNHYRLVGNYELWYDKIRAEFAGDSTHHLSATGWIYGDE